MSDQQRPLSERSPGERQASVRNVTRGLASRRMKLMLVGALESVRWAVRSLRLDPRSPAILSGVVLIGPGDGRTDITAPDRVARIPVLGEVAHLEKIIDFRLGRSLDGLVVCGAIEDRAVRRQLLKLSATLGLNLWQAQKRGEFAELRRYTASDLIGPAALAINDERLQALISGRRVLVTGAGGSIGSQLCARIATLSPARLTLMDNSEYNLFTIHHQIQADYPLLPLTHALCDVREQTAVQRWFDREQPQIVFHTAALKQLPMVEQHPSEGVLTNVLGTRILAHAALSQNAPFLLVSTDKAVDPTAVMGATKRLAEQYCQALDVEQAKAGGPRIMAARLGNVLGSAGSVVEIFERQIAAGGPVTVTDPDAQRFFITIPQAVDFLLSAAADSLNPKALRGGVHVLDMGDPIRIIDLAHDLIRLSGQRPDIDLKVAFMGLRAGEKVSERLIARDEWVAGGEKGSAISLVKAAPRTLRVLDNALDNLIDAARQRKDDQVRTMLAALVTPPDAKAGDAAKTG